MYTTITYLLDDHAVNKVTYGADMGNKFSLSNQETAARYVIQKAISRDYEDKASVTIVFTAIY